MDATLQDEDIDMKVCNIGRTVPVSAAAVHTLRHVLLLLSFAFLLACNIARIDPVCAAAVHTLQHILLLLPLVFPIVCNIVRTALSCAIGTRREQK